MPRPVRLSPFAVGPRRGAPLPLGTLGRRLDDGDAARRLQIAQAESDRVGADRGGDLVDEGFAGELDLRADRVAQVRGARRRGAVEQRWRVSHASRLLAKPSDSAGTPKSCNDFCDSPIAGPRGCRRGRAGWCRCRCARSVDAGIAGVVAAVGARAGTQMPCTLSGGRPSIWATPSRAKCGFCEPVHKVAPPARASTIAQAGPCWHATGKATGVPKSNRVVSPEFRSSINHKTRLQERSAILQIAVGNFIATALLC